jgi:hypothetical protein
MGRLSSHAPSGIDLAAGPCRGDGVEVDVVHRSPKKSQARATAATGVGSR